MLKNCSPEEWAARQELACAYRLFDHYGWYELIFNHITVRVPGTEDQFLINPFGLMYREVKASNLVKIDIEGNIIGDSAWPVNRAGFVVHSAVHAARHDAHAVIHTHTTAGQAVSCQKQGLLMMSFHAMFFNERLAYHDFEGITVDNSERARMVAHLGEKNCMILRNHGLLTCGPTLAHAFNLHYNLNRACEVQLAAQSGGAALVIPDPAIAAKSAAIWDRFEGMGKSDMPAKGQDEVIFEAMTRWMVAKDPSFLA